MKISTLVISLTLLFVHISAATLGQNITLDEQNVSLQTVFKKISQENGCVFIYEDSVLDGLGKINVHVKDVDLKTALSSCLSDLPLAFTIKNNIVGIKRTQMPVSEQQSIDISGKITDSSGQPISGVSISAQETKEGTFSDKDGRYTLSLPAGNYTLVFSYIGYINQRFRVDNSRVLNVVMNESENLLNQIVMIGYGSQKRRDVTGAISSVDTKQLANIPAMQVDELLEGRIAGAQVTSVSGEPGAGTTIQIRGSRSITASNEPLYVVDGVLDAGDLTTINPADIQSIEVLKDASATAIYGSRGANGVIIITTKRGKAGKDIINFNASYGNARIPRYLPVMDAQQWATMIDANTLASNPGTLQSQLPYPNPDSLGKGTDWTRAVTRVAPYANYTLSLNGGSKSFRYFFSGNYTDQEGIIQTSGLKRYQFRGNMNKEFSKKFNIGLTFNYAATVKRNNLVNIGSNAGWYSSTLTLPPVINIYNDDGSLEDWNPAWYSGGVINTPVALVQQEKNTTKATNLFSSFFAEWEIIKGLKLRSSISYITKQTNQVEYYPGSLPSRAFNNQGGYAYQYSSPSDQLLNENLLTYTHTWSEKHNLDLLGGWTYQKESSTYFSASGNGYFIDAIGENSLQSAPSKDLTSITSGTSAKVIASGLARVNYNYDHRYYLTLTARADGASNFAANHKWAFFPSGAVKWQLSNENFIKNIRQIDNLDLRVSYGKTGNQAIAPYQSLPQLGIRNNGYVFDSTMPVAYYPGILPNDNLTWETSSEVNLGMDVSLFKSRVNLTTEFYYTKTTNLLLNVQVPQQTGYVNRLENIGSTENRGIEITLQTDNIQKRDFTWSTSYTFAYNKQKVLDLGPLAQVITHTNYTATQYPMYAYQVGLPTSAIFGVVYAGTWKSQQDIDNNMSKYVSAPGFYAPGKPRYVDQNHDGVLDQNDCIYIGQADPKYYGGISNDFTYKNFELNFYFEYSGGNYMYNDVELEMGTGSVLTNQFTYMLNAWNAVTNPNSDIPGGNSYDHVPNTRFIHDASYLRFKDARIGYNFDLKKMNIQFFKKAAVFLSATNLLLWTKYNGYDPEVNTMGTSSTVRRNDDGAYPKNRTYAVSLNLTF